jgi:DNA repair protein RecO (recombination protein O)
MITWQDTGIVLSVRPHGENGGIASLLTRGHGRAAGYVYGATSARARSTLEPGTIVAVQWQARAENQLGTFTLEPEKSYAAAVLDDPHKLVMLQSACALADRTMPEHERHPGVFESLQALMESFNGEYWAAAYVYWEIGLLRELGFGLDLSACTATGAVDNLLYVSPRSGRAVSGEAGEAYKDKLLPLPPFLRGEARFEPEDILNGLKLTGHFLLHRVFSQANADLPEPRLRLEAKYQQKYEALKTA